MQKDPESNVGLGVRTGHYVAFGEMAVKTDGVLVIRRVNRVSDSHHVALRGLAPVTPKVREFSAITYPYSLYAPI